MSEIIINISDGTNPSVKIVALIGEMDESTIEKIKEEIAPFFDDNNIKKIILNLEKLEFINSKGIGYLVSLHTHLTKNEREIILANANESVMDVISLVGLTTIIKYFGTIEEALNNL